MVPEDLWLVVAVGIVLGVAGWPVYLLAHRWTRRNRDPLAEAHERLRAAQREAETARVNRETERIYDDLYKEAIEDEPAPTGAPGAEGEGRK
ncbi:MAG: hypothetical protein ACRENE_25420 [Polyangiaceae bacterium]